jgi:hypothetical protein
MGYVSKLCLALVLSSLIGPAHAAEEAVDPQEPVLFQDGVDADLNTFLWLKRPLIVFADSPADPRYVQQIDLLEELPDELLDRDVVVLTDTDPASKSALRQKLRPRGFMLVLMGKDGTVYLRKPLPWSVREISRSIDKLPMRQQEVEDRRITE